MKKRLHRLVCFALVFSLAGLPITAQAGLIGTDAVAATGTLQAERARLGEFVSRDEVRQQLRMHGVTEQAALERINALTDAEVAHLAGKIDELPAGAASGAVAVVGLTVLLALVTYVIVRLFYPQK